MDPFYIDVLVTNISLQNSEINTNQDKQAAKTITKDKNKH
jgi:hypothetical protein